MLRRLTAIEAESRSEELEDEQEDVTAPVGAADPMERLIKLENNEPRLRPMYHTSRMT